MRCWVTFLATIKAIFVLPVLLIIGLLGILPIFATLASLTTPLGKCHSFRLSWVGHNSFAVFVKEVKGALLGFWVAVVSRGIIILKIHLQIGVLFSTLMEEDIGDVSLLSIGSDGILLGIHQIIKVIVVQLLSNMLK